MTERDDPPTAEPSTGTYRVAVERELIAQHYLTVPDPGPEGEVHSHHFTVAVRLAGPGLDEYGYLADIDALREALDGIEERYGDALLNDLPEFRGRNPSVEHFARIVGDRIAPTFADGPATELRVRVWEDDAAWASHERPLD